MRRHTAAAAVVLITLVFVSRPAISSAQVRTGIISGIVLDERQQPVARAQVQAFSVRASVPQVRQGQTVPFSTRASGTASTDAEGRFQITGLELGDYLVAAEAVPSLTQGSRRASVYATTFYPSNIDYQTAVPVSAVSFAVTPVRIQLVRVEGVRVAGSVVREAARPTTGMDVRLYRRFGDFGSSSTVAVVDAEGRFEILRVPPGWYRLTITPQTAPTNADELLASRTNGPSESASTLIEVRDTNIEGLVLALGTGASISGRVVAEPTSGIHAVGMRVSGSLTDDSYSESGFFLAPVSSDWTFRMTGLSGLYRFGATSDRRPSVTVDRITIDGSQANADATVELTAGSHELVVFVSPREATAPAFDTTLSSAALVDLFKNENVFFRQLAIAMAIVERGDSRVLPSLTAWLSHQDRHIRGNAALIFGRLGDPRGFQVIADILTDRSDRPEGQGMATASSDGRYHVERQIATDRYYAAHLLGDLRDPRAVSILVPLLKDEQVDAIVPWALGEIGDRAAVSGMLDALDDASPAMRVLLIYALETLEAKEAVPRLKQLLNDHRKSNLGTQVTVSEAAKAAIAKLQ